MNRASSLNGLEGRHAIVSCEGTAEQVIINKLLEADGLIVPAKDVVDVTRKRNAASIQEEYLNYDYDWPVCIMRILDSRNERFRLGNLYRDRYPVVNVYTHPEIEVLMVIREGAWDRWKRSGKRPSAFCSDVLGMGNVKSADFLTDYWDVTAIANAAREYRRLSNLRRGELCLDDIIVSNR